MNQSVRRGEAVIYVVVARRGKTTVNKSTSWGFIPDWSVRVRKEIHSCERDKTGFNF